MYTKQKGDTYFSTGAYIINKMGSKKILNYSNSIYSLNKNIGHSADVYLYLITNAYVYKYPYFTYTYSEKSTIHQDHVKNHNTAKKLLTDLYKVRIIGNTKNSYPRSFKIMSNLRV